MEGRTVLRTSIFLLLLLMPPVVAAQQLSRKSRRIVADSMALNVAVDAIPDGSFAYFYGQSGQTAIFLGGSSRHLIGSSPPAGFFLSNSHLNMILWHVQELLRDRRDGNLLGNFSEDDSLMSVCRVVQNVVGRAPAQNLEFLAKLFCMDE